MTSATSIFGKLLKSLYKKGKLKAALSASFKYSHIMNLESFLGFGDYATAFMCPDRKYVLKLCCKTIGFFAYFPWSKARKFAKFSQKLNPYLLPVSEILYEDEYVMVYTQPVCQRLDKSKLTQTQIADVFNIEIGLLKSHMWTSFSGHNLGIYDGHVVIFDYHDLRPLNFNTKHLEKFTWWSRSFRHLIKLIAYYQDRSLAYQYLYAWDASGLKGLLEVDQKLRILPQFFLEFLIKIDTQSRKGIKSRTLIKLLAECRDQVQTIVA
jgi:hypothetical protein